MFRALFSGFELDLLTSKATSSEAEATRGLFSVIDAMARTKTSKRNKKTHFLIAKWLVELLARGKAMECSQYREKITLIGSKYSMKCIF